MRPSIRIGAGQGFYGDTAQGAVDVARSGDVGYICCDALAELTMTILARDRAADAGLGYTRDLAGFAERLLPACRERGIRVVTNAGGLNPMAAAAAVAGVAHRLGMDDLRIAAVVGDDIRSRLGELRAAGVSLAHLDTGADAAAVLGRTVAANAYLGARPIVDALERGADVVVTGRVADASLFLAPLVHELGWGWDDWDRLAAGVVVGHLMECSGQATGGNFSGDWWNVPELDRVGYPVCEVDAGGSAVLTKPPGTGGRVSVDTVKEQLLYEVLDPAAYANPDVVADFTTVRLAAAWPGAVAVTGATGRPRPEALKCVLGYPDGWAGTATIGYSWPDAEAKARRAAELVERICERSGLHPTERVVEIIGVDSLHGGAADPDPAVNEVVLRVCCRFETEIEAAAFPRAMLPLVLNGPPFVGGGLPPQSARRLVGVWPALVPRGAVEPLVEVVVEAAGRWLA